MQRLQSIIKSRYHHEQCIRKYKYRLSFLSHRCCKNKLLVPHKISKRSLLATFTSAKYQSKFKHLQTCSSGVLLSSGSESISVLISLVVRVIKVQNNRIVSRKYSIVKRGLKVDG